MDLQIAIVLGLLCFATIAFAREWLSVDLVTLFVLLGLLVTGILTPEEAFRGFGSDVVIMLSSVFILSAALRETGVVSGLGEHLARLSRRGGFTAVTAATMGAASAMSAIMNNTAVTAILIEPVSALARRLKVSPSRLLMPLAFASILGGTCTVIGTSTNIAVSAFLTSRGERAIGFFELSPLGIIFVGAGIMFMLTFGRRLLPDYKGGATLTESYGLQQYLSEVIIQENSPLIGKALKECDLGEMDLRVLSVLRGRRKLALHSNTHLQAGDVLLVRGDVQSLMKVRAAEGIEIRADVKFGDADLKGEDEIMELLITPLSALRGRQLDELDLAGRHGIIVLAINRHGHLLRNKLKSVRLEMGDQLLVRGSRDTLAAIRTGPDFAPFGEQNFDLHRPRKGMMTLLFLLGGVAVSAMGIVSLPVGLLAAAVACVCIKALPAHRMYEVIEWRLLVLIAGMIALGAVMEKTGAADLVASYIVMALKPGGEVAVLAGFVLLTVVLTQPMSNAAAALVILPIAFSTAAQLGANPRSFAIAICYAASVSLVAPFEPSSLLVYGPGKYRVMDFLKIGGLLTLLLVIIILFGVPLLWPLKNGG